MESISLVHLAKIVGGHLVRGEMALEPMQRVTIHSRHIMHGSIFFALPGARADGHDFVDQALENGAVGAVVARGKAAERHYERGPIIEVADTVAALQQLAGWWRSQLSETKVVAVVGSSGKTVTKDALVHILGSSRRAFGSPGSFNSQIGVPLALLDCPKGNQFAVIEAAATEPGEMAILREIIRPDDVVFTNLATRHASNFRNPRHHAEELLSIAARLPGWLLLGDEQTAVRAVADSHDVTAIYDCHSFSEVPVLKTVENNTKSTTIHLTFPDGLKHNTVIQTPFEEIREDIQLAVAAAWLLGIDAGEIVAALDDYVPTATRMEVWQSPAGWTVVRDVATTDAVTISLALDVSRRLARPLGDSRLFVVLADTLTSCTQETAQALGRTIAISGLDSLWALESAAHQQICNAVQEIAPDVRVHHFDSIDAMRPPLLDALRSDDVVLVESPRERSLAEVTSTLMEPLAAARLFIDRTALESNVITFRQLIGPSGRLLAMVKALAYGTNLVQVSRLLVTAGADQLGVATADEGATLRRSNISVPILVTLGTTGEMEKMIAHDLTPLIYSQDLLDSAITTSRQNHRKQPIDIHLEVDTGMHRTGFLPAAAISALRQIQTEPTIRLVGIMTHLACADDPAYDKFTRLQLETFEKVANAARDLGYTELIRHAANTAATLRFPEAHFDMVRVGIGLYGVYPSTLTEGDTRLEHVVSLVSQLVATAELSADEIIGYGATYRVPATGRRVGTVAAGYHDCVPRAFSNVGYVAIDGQRCPIIGSISMDSMIVDITDCPSAQVGSDVVIYGERSGSSVSIEQAAETMGTVPHELLARVGPRVQRVLTNH